MITVAATDIQNNFEKYLQAVQNGDEIIILKNGTEVARLVSKEKCHALTDALTGVLKNDYDEKAMREKGFLGMKILIDTNVILDVLCSREKF